MTDPVSPDLPPTQATHGQSPAEAAKADMASSSAAAEKTAAAVNWEEQVAHAKKEAADYYNRYLRSVADLENHRKRAMREKEEVRQFGCKQLLEDLLPVLDNFALGLAAAKQPQADVKSIVGGIEMTQSQLKNALANHGLKEINPVGQAFDPHQHEAISHLPSAEVPAEHVLTVVRTGYSLQGRLLRPASVVVSSGPAKTEA